MPVVVLALLSGCAMIERSPERVVVLTSVTQFSSGEPGETCLRAGALGPSASTEGYQYSLVKDDGRPSSGLRKRFRVGSLSGTLRASGHEEFPLL